MFALEIIGHVSNVAGAIGGIVAAVGVLKMLAAQRRGTDHINVLLFHPREGGQDGYRVTLPLEMLRRDISRAELLGRLGMLPMCQKGSRFSLGFLSTPAFMRAVNEVVEGKTSTLVIPCTKEELDQFAIL